MTVTLEDTAAVLEDFIRSREEEIECAQKMLHLLRHGPGPNQPMLSEQPAKKARAAKKAPKKAKAPSGGGSEVSRRRFTDEEKADIVDRAAELGSMSAAAAEVGVTGTTIANWKAQGFGNG